MRKALKLLWASAMLLGMALAVAARGQPAAAQEPPYWAWIDMYGHCVSYCEHPPNYCPCAVMPPILPGG
jgi:hypothetical protein